MLLGKDTNLYKAEQVTLAAWATMFVMTANRLDPEMGSITPEERTWLKDNQHPPAHWRIWIGKYERPATKNVGFTPF